MNAAFLLVTTAWLTGQPAAAPPPAAPAAAAPAPAASASCNGSSCGSSCYDPCGCESFGHRFRARLGGLFNRGCCEPTCASTCAPACTTTCAPAPSCCDSCGHGGNFLGRMRGLFHRGNNCCDAGCTSGCASTGAATTPPPAGEHAPPPAKMPAATPAPATKPAAPPPPKVQAPVAPGIQPVQANPFVQTPAINNIPAVDFRSPF